MQNVIIGEVTTRDDTNQVVIRDNLKITRVKHPLSLENRYAYMFNTLRTKSAWSYDDVSRKMLRDLLYDKYKRDVYITAPTNYESIYYGKGWTVRILLDDNDRNFNINRNRMRFHHKGEELKVYIKQTKTLNDAIREGVVRKL